MAKNNSNRDQLSFSLMGGTAAGLHVFWILNVLKEAFVGVKNVLNFYPPVGPLLGLFTAGVLSIVGFTIAAYYTFGKNASTPGFQRHVFWFYVLSAVVFALMVFPPFSEPLVELLSGK